MKKSRTTRIFLLVSIGFMLAGCSNVDPDCASKETSAIIIDILLNQNNIFKSAVIDEFPTKPLYDETHYYEGQDGIHTVGASERAASPKGRAYFSKNASYSKLISLYDVYYDEIQNAKKDACKDRRSKTCFSFEEKRLNEDIEWNNKFHEFFYSNFLNSSNYMNYTLSSIRTQSKESDTKAVSCVATLTLFVPDLFKGSKDITYKVELTSDKETYVSVYGIAQ